MDQPQRRGIHALASMLPKVTAPIFKALRRAIYDGRPVAPY